MVNPPRLPLIPPPDRLESNNVSKMPSILTEIGGTFLTLAKGFSVTFRNIWRKPTTENYPDEPVHFQARYRGIHVLHRDENGLESA